MVVSKTVKTPKDDATDSYVREGLSALTIYNPLTWHTVPIAASGLVLLTYFPENSPHKWQPTAINMRLAKHSIMECLEFWVDLWIKDRKKGGLKLLYFLAAVFIQVFIHFDVCG